MTLSNQHYYKMLDNIQILLKEWDLEFQFKCMLNIEAYWEILFLKLMHIIKYWLSQLVIIKFYQQVSV